MTIVLYKFTFTITITIGSLTATSYLPSSVSQLGASTPFDRYRVILLGERGTQVQVPCLRPLRNGAEAGLEPKTYELQVQCITNSNITLLYACT